MEAATFDELLDIKYGEIGTPERDEFEESARNFAISELLKEARREAKITQEQLAEKIGTKKAIFRDWKTGSATSSSGFLNADWAKG